jgi:AhpD family alkylhydroperoxidase
MYERRILLLLSTAWEAGSARRFAQRGFVAIATISGGLWPGRWARPVCGCPAAVCAGLSVAHHQCCKEFAGNQRLDYKMAPPAAFKAMLGLKTCARESGLEHSLLELMKIRASQINGCACCRDISSKVARATGKSEPRLHLLAAWRETPFYTSRERAALTWVEAVTLVASNDLANALYAEVRAQFGYKATVELAWPSS